MSDTVTETSVSDPGVLTFRLVVEKQEQSLETKELRRRTARGLVERLGQILSMFELKRMQSKDHRVVSTVLDREWGQGGPQGEGTSGTTPRKILEAVAGFGGPWDARKLYEAKVQWAGSNKPGIFVEPHSFDGKDLRIGITCLSPRENAGIFVSEVVLSGDGETVRVYEPETPELAGDRGYPPNFVELSPGRVCESVSAPSMEGRPFHVTKTVVREYYPKRV